MKFRVFDFKKYDMITPQQALECIYDGSNTKAQVGLDKWLRKLKLTGLANSNGGKTIAGKEIFDIENKKVGGGIKFFTIFFVEDFLNK